MYHGFNGWQLVGSKLRFEKLASKARTLRAVYTSFQANLSDDATVLDRDDFREAIVKYAVHLALNSLKINRVRYHEYAAALNDRASTPDELIRLAYDIKNQAILCREEKAYPRPAGFAKCMRTG